MKGGREELDYTDTPHKKKISDLKLEMLATGFSKTVTNVFLGR